MKLFKLLFILSFASIAAFYAVLNASANHNNPPQVKVTICHNDGQSGNYSQLEVDDEAVDGNSSNQNGSDHNSSGHQNGRDIIPPGAWDNDGRNWNSAGQAIWNNNCNAVTVTPTPTPTPTPTSTPTPTPTVTLTPTPTPTPEPEYCDDEEAINYDEEGKCEYGEEVVPTPTATPTPTVTCENQTNGNSCNTNAEPTPTVTSEPTATPTPTNTPTPTLAQTTNTGGPGDGLSDGRSDGRSDGLSGGVSIVGSVSVSNKSQKQGEVLGASTMAGTGTFTQTASNALLDLGAAFMLLPTALYGWTKKKIFFK